MSSEPNVVEVDLHGNQVTQAIVDLIWQKAQQRTEPGEPFNLLIRNITGPIPRLIVDYNQIYEALSELLNKRNK